ncbi:MAG: MBL fold metallo-hydrolase [Candidatus Methanomethylophilus sp.]|nr:MBL fold metallo-hydrolase [Methanomethylophilus sp.]
MSEKATVTDIYDEGAKPDTRFIGAQGFAMVIDVDGQRTLFGTGRRGRYLAHNLSQADLTADVFDRLAVSHGHLDHCGGFRELIAERTPTAPKLPVYAPVSAWDRKGHIRVDGLYGGTDEAGRYERHDVYDWTDLSEHLALSPALPFDGGAECVMVIRGATGPVVICGCAHPGLQKIVDVVKARYSVPPQTFIGGLHIGKKNDKRADECAQVFESCGCKRLYLNHCTAVEGTNRMRVTLGLHGVKDFYAGMTLSFDL